MKRVKQSVAGLLMVLGLTAVLPSVADEVVATAAGGWFAVDSRAVKDTTLSGGVIIGGATNVVLQSSPDAWGETGGGTSATISYVSAAGSGTVAAATTAREVEWTPAAHSGTNTLTYVSGTVEKTAQFFALTPVAVTIPSVTHATVTNITVNGEVVAITNSVVVMPGSTVTVDYKADAGYRLTGDTSATITNVAADHKTIDISTVTVALLAPAITDVTALQRYPWNGKVDLSYIATDVVATASDRQLSMTLKVLAVDRSTEPWTTNVADAACLFVGPRATEALTPAVALADGAHQIVWDMNAQGLSLVSTNVVFAVACEGALSLGGVQLWEGGPYFAECNVGASKPEESGYYFWWGDTVGYKRNSTNDGWDAVDGSTTGFQFNGSNAKIVTYNKSIDQLLSAGYVDSTTNLVAKYDGAITHLGAPWRLPTLNELLSLVANCTTTWTNNWNGTGINGRLVTGKGEYASKSLFLPAAGWGGDSDLRIFSTFGALSSSTPTSGSAILAWGLNFSSSVFTHDGSGQRCHGRNIRPVREASGPTTLCAGESAQARVDLATGIRIAASMETLTYSAAWYGGDSVTLAANDTTLASGLTGSGTYAWTPSTEGMNVLTHTVVTNGFPEVLTATFLNGAMPCSTWAEVKAALEAGYSVKLTQDIVQDSSACVPTGTVTLDLNGYTIDRTDICGTYRFMEVTSSGVTLTIADTSAGKTSKVIGDSTKPFPGEHAYAGCIYVSAGKVVINGGTFTGARAAGGWSMGGFIRVDSGAALEMNGGTLTDCGGTSSGGAVYISGGASFTFNGGTITNCYAHQGGGVTIDGTMTMNGGKIVDCRASGANGGALYVDGNATINGGTVTNCTSAGNGGAICAQGTVTVNGGVFVDNKAGGSATASSALFYLNVSVNGGVSDSSLIGDKKASGKACTQVGTKYVVGTSITCDADDKLATGTYTFCPTNAEYAAAGVAVAPSSTLSEDPSATPKTWTLTDHRISVAIPSVTHATVTNITVNGTVVAVTTPVLVPSNGTIVVWYKADTDYAISGDKTATLTNVTEDNKTIDVSKVTVVPVYQIEVDTSSTYKPTKIINGGFDVRPFEPYKYNNVVYNTWPGESPANVYWQEVYPNGVDKGWNTTETKLYNGGLFEYSSNPGTYGLSSSNGGFIEMNAYNSAVFFQDLTTYGGDVIRWGLSHGCRANIGEQIIRAEIGAPNGVPTGVGNNVNSKIVAATLAKYTYTGVENPSGAIYGYAGSLGNLRVTTTGWHSANGIYVIPEDQTVTRFAFIAVKPTDGCGNLLDDLTFSTLIGNLKARVNDDGTVTITGYWGDSDASKKLMVKIGDGAAEAIDMSGVLNKNFKITVAADKIGLANVLEVYHQDYVQAKRSVIIGWSVTLNLNATDATCAKLTEYQRGTVTVLPIPTRPLHVFDGWFDNVGLTGTPVASIPADATGAKEFWAKWHPVVSVAIPSVTHATVTNITVNGEAVAVTTPVLVPSNGTIVVWYKADTDYVFTGDSTATLANVTEGNKTIDASGVKVRTIILYYVSATGNDGNAGTVAAPLKTLTAAYNRIAAAGSIGTIALLSDITVPSGTSHAMDVADGKCIIITSATSDGTLLDNAAGDYTGVWTIKRGSCTATIIDVTAASSLTLRHVVMSGEGKRFTAYTRFEYPLIRATDGTASVITMDTNSILRDNRPTGSYSTRGGAVEIGIGDDSGICPTAFYMISNAAMIGNEAARHGGAVTAYNCDFYMTDDARMEYNGINMVGGEYFGGGAILAYGARIHMSGNATIARNYVQLNGCGDGGRMHNTLQIDPDLTMASLDVRDNVRVFDNYDNGHLTRNSDGSYTLTGTIAANVFAGAGKMTITGAMGDEAKIGVTVKNAAVNSVIANGTSAYTVTSEDANQFFDDSGTYTVIKHATNNQLVFGSAVTSVTLALGSLTTNSLSGTFSADIGATANDITVFKDGVKMEGGYALTVSGTALAIAFDPALPKKVTIGVAVSKNGYKVNNGEVVYIELHQHCICGDGECTATGHVHADIEWQKWTNTTALPTSAGNYYLANNVTISSTYQPVNGVNICLNGKVVKQTAAASVITVNAGVNLTLTDCEETEHKYVVDSYGVWGWNDSASGGTAYEDLTARPAANDVIIVKGGAITGGHPQYNGGGIYYSGNVTLHHVNIVGNKTTAEGGSSGGGGLFNISASSLITLTMNGAKVIGNYSADWGGGIHNETLNGTYKADTYRRIYMTGGAEISFNNVRNAGGAVYTYSYMDMEKGSALRYNYSGRRAGAVAFAGAAMSVVDGQIVGNYAGSSEGDGSGAIKMFRGTLTFGGTTVVTNNLLGSAKVNVYLPSGLTSTVSTAAPLAEGAKIGVKTATAPTAGKPVAVTTACTADMTAYFSSDVSAYYVKNGDGNVVQLALIGTGPVVKDTAGNDVVIEIPTVWRETYKATPEEVMRPELKMKNGMPAWQNYVLGIEPTNALSGVYADAPQNTATDKVTVKTKNVVKVADGYTVQYRLDTKLGSAAEYTKGTPQASADIDVTLSGTDPTGLYKLNVVISKGSAEIDQSAEAVNTVGLVKATNTNKYSVIAVPWNRLAPGEEADIAVSNVIKTANLEAGDKLHVYRSDKRSYDTWTLNENKQWDSAKNYKIGKDGKVSATESDDAVVATIARGNGVWLERLNPTNAPYFLYGQATSNAAEIVVEEGHNLLGAPGLEPFALSHIKGAAEEHDQVLVPGAQPKLFTFKNGQWGTYRSIEVTTGETIFGETTAISNVWTTAESEIPAGTGYWLINKSGNPIIIE